MSITQEKRTKTRALLVGSVAHGQDEEEALSLLEELVDLVGSLNIEVAESVLVRLRKTHAPFLLGKGKVDEIIALAQAHDCDLIVFDHELSPAQQRNWEKESELVVIDRQEVILDIFAERAQTKEAVLQVELAYWEYALPRLKRAWTHLSRQRGGSVTQRGEGEKQIELDQRIVRQRIAKLKRELAEVVQHRGVQRKQRMKVPIPTASIIGYTNAGKSSLLQVLTKSDILVEDKLFATLDPVTRRLKLPSGRLLLLTDTVGFVRRLPHRLVDAFKATLEEAIHADFLIHVMDLSSPDVEQHRQTTLDVLAELNISEKRIIPVFNKVDLQEDALFKSSLKAQFPESIFVSVHTGEGLDVLQSTMDAVLEDSLISAQLLIPYKEYEWVARLHQMGCVCEEKDDEAGVWLKVHLPKRVYELLSPFVVQ